MSTNYPQDAYLTNYQCNCLDRLKVELSGKQYYPDDIYVMLLAENKLSATDVFNKDTMNKKLLTTVYCVLESLSNNLDVFRNIETEFGNYGEAYQYLSKRLDNLRWKIDNTPDNYIEESEKSSFSFMYTN